MSTLGGSRGERNAKPKFAALDINKLYITSRGETLEPSAQKSAAPRKHGMQSLGKVPTARRPPANLPSLKAEVSSPGEQSGSWTSDQNEGANVNNSPSHRIEKSTSSNQGSQGNSTQVKPKASHKNSKTCESTWSTNEFPSLDDAGSCGRNANKPQHSQDHYPGAPQLMLRPQTDAASWMQQKGSGARGTVSGTAVEMTDGVAVSNGLGATNNPQNTAVTIQTSPLPPQFRALLPTFMQRGNDGGSAGSENEGGSGSSGLSQPPLFSSASSSYNDTKHNSITHGIINNNIGDGIGNSNNKKSSKAVNINKVVSSSSTNSSSFGSNANSNINNNTYDDTNSKILGKAQNQFPQKQSQHLGSHHDHPQQTNRNMGGGNNFSVMPPARGVRATGRMGGPGGASMTAVGDGGAERGSGIPYNDNHHQYANRRGASNHPSRYARNAMGGGVGNHNASTTGHSRGIGAGNSIVAGDHSGSGGFHDENRNSHPPYGVSALAEQEVVVRPIIRDEELQRLEVIAKDEGWAKDYEFDYNQKLEFSDDESENNPTTVSAQKDKITTTAKPEKKATGWVEEDSDREVGDKDGQDGSSTVQANGSSTGRGVALAGSDSGVGVANSNNAVGGLDGDAKERIKQRREEDHRREMERKQAAARKLQELEQKLSRKKVEESGDINATNNETTSAGNVSTEDKSEESVVEHQQHNERIISVKIRGKSDERGNFKEIRYEFGSGGGGVRHDRDREAVSINTAGAGAGNSWDMPGFSKTFQSNLPPRFQKRKLERNTSGANLMTNSNNVANSNQTVSRMNSNASAGASSSSIPSAGGEIKSGIPFAQQYDPRFIHNQQTMGKSAASTASGSRRAAPVSGPTSARERDERQRQQYEVHDQREVMKGRLDSTEDPSHNNHAKHVTQGGGRITPQLVRSLSESSNRKTSVSSDDNHYVVHHGQHQQRSSSGNNTGMATNYGREMSWDMEVEKGTSKSSPTTFVGSERQRDTPPRPECEAPKQILHRLKEVTSPVTSETKQDEQEASSSTRLLKTQTEDNESNNTDDKTGKVVDHHTPSVSSTALSDAGSASSLTTSANPENMGTERIGKASESTAEFPSAMRKTEASLNEITETGINECEKDTTRPNNSYQARSVTDDKQQLHQQVHHGVKKKGAPYTQQHSRDNRRQDSRGGSRGSSYGGSGAGAGTGAVAGAGISAGATGFHRIEGTSSNRGGSANWNRARGGGRVGPGSRNYNQDCWSESEYSEESFDEQSKQHPLHHHNQAQYQQMSAHAITDGTGNAVGSKEGFVPRGEPSRRGRGGGNVGTNVSLTPVGSNTRQQLQTPVSAIESVGNVVSKKIEGYGPPNSKSPFGGSINNVDERRVKHSFGDGPNIGISKAGSPTRDDRAATKHLRPNTSENDPGNAVDTDNDESHSREDKLLVHQSGSRSSGMSIESSDMGDTNKGLFGTMKDDAKAKAKSTPSTMSTKTISGTVTTAGTTTATTTGSVNNNNDGGATASYRTNNTTATTVVGATSTVGSFRGGSNNHSTNSRKQMSTSRGQGIKGNSGDFNDTTSLTSLPSRSNCNQTIATPSLLQGATESGDIKLAAGLNTHSSILSTEGEASDRHLLSQQSTIDKMSVVPSSSASNAKTDNEKLHLDGNTPPVNTIIFENTNYKSGVNVGGLSGTSTSNSTVVSDYASLASKVGADIINENPVAAAVTGNIAGGTLTKSQQSLSSNPSGHRGVALSKTVAEGASDVCLQQTVVGNSQRTVLSTVISKQQQQSSNAITGSLQGIPFQKADNDYKEIKPYAFETDISHLIDGEKGIKQQSTVTSGLSLSKSIEATDGTVNHGGVAVSVQSIISPSTADLNMKIASVKKVWEMPTVPEQTGSATGVNAGSGSGIACNVNVANDHAVGGSGSVAGGTNAHLKSNYVRGPHHQSHQAQYQNPHTTSGGHHAHQTHGTHGTPYGAAFASESDSLVEHFNNSTNVCPVPSSVGTNNPCDIGTGTVITSECNDNPNAAYGLSHHHAQAQQTSAKPHSQTPQTHQLQQHQHHHQQQEMSHQRQQHHLQEASTQQQQSQQHSQQTQKQLQQHHQSQHSLQQQHTQQLQQQQQHRQQQHQKEQQPPQQQQQQSSQQQQQQQPPQQHQQHQQQHQQHQHQHQHQQQHQQAQQQQQHVQHLQHLQHMQQQSQPQHKSQGQPQSQLQTTSQVQPQPQSQTSQSQPQPQIKSQQQPQQQPQQLSQQLPQQLQQSQSQLPHQHQHQSSVHKQAQHQPLQQQLQQQHPVQQHPHQLQQSHHQQPHQMQHQQQQAQQQSQQHVSSVVSVQQQQQQQHQAAVAATMGLNKHPVADVLAAAVGANNVNVCKVKPTQQGSAGGGGGLHQSNSMGLSPPPQMQSGSMPSAPQPFYPAQYGVSAIPSPPAVLYNSPAAAAAAMSSQGGLYNAFQIEPSGRSQFSQFPGHYGTSGTAGPYNAYMAATPTNMQAGPTPEMFQSLSSQFRMGSVQSPYSQSTQMGNPNTMLISSNNSSLMSSSVKSSTQQIGAIGQPKPSGGSVNQPPYGQQYLNMFPPAPMQNTAASYYSNSAGGQNAFFGTAGATGGATQNAYGIPAGAVAASSMFGHGGQNPSNTPQPPPPQQQMPSYSSQYLNSPLLAAANPSMGQQQYRGAPTNSSQHSGASAAAYIKSNQSPQSSHIQHQQQQQQPDTWDLKNQLIQHQQQINQQPSAPPQLQQPLLSNGPVGQQLLQPQANQHSSNHSRNMLPTNHNQLVSGGNSGAGSVGASGNAGSSTVRVGPPQAPQGSGVSGTRYPSPIQRPINFSHASAQVLQQQQQHHQQRNRPVGHGSQPAGAGNNNGGQQQQGGSSTLGQGVNNANKHYYGGNRG